MALELVDSVNGDGLFNVLGKFAHLLATLNTARGTTVAAEAEDALQQWLLQTGTLDLDRALRAFSDSEKSWRVGGDSFAASIAATCQRLLQVLVQADSGQPLATLAAQVDYLIEQMKSQGYYVAGHTVAMSAAADAGNTSVNDLQFILHTKDAAGYTIQQLPAEVLQCDVSDVSGKVTTLAMTGTRAARSVVAEDWPAGSGARAARASLSASDSLLLNPSFTDATSDDLLPPHWQLLSGTTVVMQTPQVQEIEITGTPTKGYYLLTVLHPFTGAEYTTAPLAYNASSAEVQAALRALPEYEQVTVSTTGTSPNYLHQVTMWGVSGGDVTDDVAQIGTSDSFDTGSIATSITTASEGGILGQSLTFASHASETPKIAQNVTIEPDTAYVLACQIMRKAGTPGTGRFRLSLTDSAGTILTDEAGNSLTVTKNFSSLPLETPTLVGFVCSVPHGTAMPVRVQIEKDVAASMVLAIDEVILAPVTPLYSSGPYVIPVVCRSAPAVGERWTVTSTNNHASQWQLRAAQLLDLHRLGRSLPTSGSTAISDSLIG